jgi:hypothetical protein
MDEEDGRSGAMAAQTGQLDALTDAPTIPLCTTPASKFNVQSTQNSVSYSSAWFVANAWDSTTLSTLRVRFREGNRSTWKGCGQTAPFAGGGETP